MQTEIGLNTGFRGKAAYNDGLPWCVGTALTGLRGGIFVTPRLKTGLSRKPGDAMPIVKPPLFRL